MSMSHTTIHGVKQRPGVFARISRYLRYVRWYYSHEQVLIRKWEEAHGRGEGHTPGAIIRNKWGGVEFHAIEVITPPDISGRWTLYGGRKVYSKDIVEIDECKRLRDRVRYN